MALHDRGWPLLAHLAFDQLVDRLSLVLAGGDENQLTRLHDGGQALGDAVGGDGVNVPVEEAGVVPARLLGQDVNVRARVQRAAGLVEADVTVRADAQDLQVAVPGRGHTLLIAGAGHL
ncbi:MAG: hypothetical protein Q605_AUC01050G0003 [Actinomyces urogenitalis DORA_12]|uniref:Uncharacterized protein n=1 Tax=Actinomyces urogenitalis DORA_12 TaxID=1403939 RepID=W1VAD8_9ACTO|nr:MAG: hypothetical protein Q605_AUC01050G0003 [Actinomyces urogenitalis DORA_12]